MEDAVLDTELNTQNHVVDDLVQRCQTLRDELQTFRDHLQKLKKQHTVELAHFRGVVDSEWKHLQRLSERAKTAGEDVSQHNAASSNLPFLESVWTAAKCSTGVVALQKRFFHGPLVARISDQTNGSHQRSTQVRKHKALVDVVAGEGLEWTKVSLVTNHRILMDKAKEGWADDSSDGEEEGSDDGEDDIDRGIPIVKMAEGLVAAAQAVRIRTRHPNVRLLVPKIEEGKHEAVDNILERIRGLGIQVDCTEPPPMPSTQPFVDTMITDPFQSFTKTLNIDCTILLALVSDFSHAAVQAEPWFHRALSRQVEMEDEEHLLPTVLYPAICDRDLICTEEAAKRMREIVGTIGTEGEKVRTALFMGDDEAKPTSQTIHELQEWSRIEIPSTLRLPIKTVKAEGDWETLPSVARLVVKNLTNINRSVFIHGWSMHYTTITSNRSVAKQIDNVLDANAKDESDWPHVWLCPIARSLVGKEKDRAE